MGWLGGRSQFLRDFPSQKITYIFPIRIFQVAEYGGPFRVVKWTVTRGPVDPQSGPGGGPIGRRGAPAAVRRSARRGEWTAATTFAAATASAALPLRAPFLLYGTPGCV